MIPTSADVGFPQAPAPSVDAGGGPFLPPFDPGLGMGPAPTPQLLPPPPPIEIPDKPTSAFKKEAFAYVSDWLSKSHNYTKAKVPEWERALKLLHNKLSMNDIEDRQLEQSQDETTQVLTQQAQHRTDFVYPILPACNAFASASLTAITSGPDPFLVIPADADTAQDLLLARKVQKMLLDGLEEGHFHTNLFSALLRLPPLGAQYAKVFWQRETYTKTVFDQQTQELREVEEVIRECPIVQAIPLDRILVDPQAKHNDIQRWRGIGHRVLRTYHQVLESFVRGDYTLNKNEFLNRWSAGGNGSASMSQDMDADPDADILTDSEFTTWLDVWEFHGRVPSSSMGRLVECSCTILTEPLTQPDESSTLSGVMVRLTTRPVLNCGKRPFVGAVWKPEPPGPFGQSLQESIRDIHVTLSQFMGQIQDMARFSASPMWIAKTGSNLEKDLRENGTFFPGRVFLSEHGDDLTPVTPPQINMQAVLQATEMLDSLLQRESSSTDSYLGVGGDRKTATEASMLQQQSQIPNSTVLSLFVRDYVQPALNLCLELYKQYSTDDRCVILKGPTGQMQPEILSGGDLQRGQFKVVVTISNQDSTRVAKAAALQQLLATAPNIQPLLMQAGKGCDWGELIQRILDLSGIDGSDRVIYPLPPQPPMQPGMGMQDQSGMGGPPGMGGSPSSFFGQNGGPMGPEPSGDNQVAQLLQMIQGSNQSGQPFEF